MDHFSQSFMIELLMTHEKNEVSMATQIFKIVA